MGTARYENGQYRRLGPRRVGGNQSRSKDLSSDFNSSTASHNRTNRKVRADKNAVPRETHDKRSRPLPPIIQESTVEDQVEISASRVTVMLGQFSKDTRHNDHTSDFKHATGTPTSKTEITAPSNTFLTLAAFSWNGRNEKDLVPTKAAHRNPKRKQPAHKHFREHVHTDHNAQGSQKKETKVRRTKGKSKAPSLIEAFLRQASRRKVPLRLAKEKIILTRARTAQDVPDPSTKSGNAFRSSNLRSENSTSRPTDEPVSTSASKTFERVVAGVTTPQTVIVPKHTNASAKSTNKSHYSILFRQHGASPFTTARKNAPIVSTNKTSEVNDQNDQTVPLTFVVVPARTPNIHSAIVSNVAKQRLKSRGASTSQELKTETQQMSSKSEKNVRNGILNKVLNRLADSALKDRNVYRPESLSSTTAQNIRKQIPPRRRKRDLANVDADLDVDVDDVIDDFIGAHPRVSLRDKRTAIVDSDISELMGRKTVLQRIARDNTVNLVKPDLSGSPGYHLASPSKTGPTSESATTFTTKESPLTDRDTNINLVVNAEKSALGYGGVDFHVESIFDEGGQEKQQHRGDYLRHRKASDILSYLGNPDQRGIRPMGDVDVEHSRRQIRDSDEGNLVDSDNGDVENTADEGNNDEGSEEEDDDGEGQDDEDDDDTGDDGQEELSDDHVRRRKASSIKQLLDGLERGTLRSTGQVERRYKREIDEGDRELDSDAVEDTEDEGDKDPAIVDDDDEEEEEEGYVDEGHDDNDDNDKEDSGQDYRKRRRKALDIMQYLGALKQRTPRYMTGGGVQRKRRHRRENDDSDSNDNGKGNDKDHGDEGEGNKEKDRENKKRDKGDDNGNQKDEKNNDESFDEDSHEDNGLEDTGATAIPLAEKKVSEGDSMLKLEIRNSFGEKTHRLKGNPLSQRPATATDRKSNGSSPPRTEGEKEMDLSGNTFETEQKSDPLKEPTSHGEGSSDAEERNQGHPSTPEHVAKEDRNPQNKNINMSITEIRHMLYGLLQNETKDFVPNPSSRETEHHLRKKRKVLGKHRYPAQSVEQRLALEAFRMEPEEIEMDIVEPTRPDHGDALFDRIIQDTQIRPDELRMDEKVPDAIGEAKKWKRRRRRNAKNEKTAGPELAAIVKDAAKDSPSEPVRLRVRRSVTAGLNDVLTDSRPRRFSHVPRYNEKARERTQRSVFDDDLLDDDDVDKMEEKGEEDKDDEVAKAADEADDENGGDNTDFDGDIKGVDIFENMILDSALDEAEDTDGNSSADDDEPCDNDSDDDCEHAEKKHKSDGDAKRKKRSDWMKLIDNGDGDVDYEDDENEDEPCDDDSDDCENDEQSEESDDDNGEDETDDNAEEGDEPCDSSSGDDCESADQNQDLDTVLRRRKRSSDQNQDLDTVLRRRKRSSEQNQDLDTNFRKTKRQSEQNQDLDTDLRREKQLEQNQDLNTDLRRKRQSEQNLDLDTDLRRKKQLEQNQDLNTDLRRKRQSDQNQDLDTDLIRRKRSSEQNQDLDTNLRKTKRQSEQNQDLDTVLRRRKRQSEQNRDLDTDLRRKKQLEQNQDLDTDLRREKQLEQNLDLDIVLRRRKRQSDQNQDLDTNLRKTKRQSKQNQDLNTDLRRKKQSEQNLDLDTDLRREKQLEQNLDLDTDLRREKQSEQNQDLDTDLRREKQLEQNQDLNTVLRRKRLSDQKQDLDTNLRKTKSQSEHNQDLDTVLRRRKRQSEQNQDLDTVLRRKKRQSGQNQDLDTNLRKTNRQSEQKQDLDTDLRRKKQSEQNQDLNTVFRRRKKQSEQNLDLDTDLRRKKQLEQNLDLDSDLRRKKQSEQNQDLDTVLRRRKKQSKQNLDLDTDLRRKKQSEQNQDLDTVLRRRKKQSDQNQDLDTDLRRRKRQSDELTEADNDDDIDSIADDGDDENDGQPCDDETDDDCDTAEQDQGWDSDLRMRRKKRSAETKEDDDEDCDDSGGGGGDDDNDRDDDDTDERADDDDKDSDGDDNSSDSDNSRGSDTQPASKPHGKNLEITPTPKQLARIDKAASQIMKTVFFEAVDDLLGEDDCPDIKQDDRDNKEYYESIFSDYVSPSSSKDDAGDPYGSEDFDFDDIFTSSRITRLKEEPPRDRQDRQNRPAGNGSAQLVGEHGAGYLQSGERISKKIPGYIDDRNYAGAENIGIETAASVISRLLMEEHLDNTFFELD